MIEVLRVLGVPQKWPQFSLIELHQASAHFPIALLLSSVLFDFLGAIFKKETLRQSAFAMHLFGTLTAVLTVALGWFGNPYSGAGAAAQRANIHRWWGVATLVVFALLALWRLARRNDLAKRERLVYGSLALLGVAVVLVTGYLGARIGG
jgi:uncharacterized membrane protein